MPVEDEVQGHPDGRGPAVPPEGAVRQAARPPVKRSATVSLVLVAGAGATALALGQFDPSQREEDVLVYPNAQACITAQVRLEAECNGEFALAAAEYPRAAPRYDTQDACEAHHGPAHCVAGGSVTEEARGQFVPVMAGYLIGRTAAQALPPQPVFDHAPRNETYGAYSGPAGYCTGWGGRISTASGGRAAFARVASSSVRRAAFGGFGGTGRSFSSSSSSHGFFGG